MILVSGRPLDPSSTTRDIENLLFKLLDHPELEAASNAFKQTEFRMVKAPYPSGNEDFDSRQNEDVPEEAEEAEDSNFVYIFQKEFATVSHVHVPFAGTDEITTCLGLVMRDPLTCLTGIGHFDSEQCVQSGVDAMINSIAPKGIKTRFQVHMVGAFDDKPDDGDSHQGTPPSDPKAWTMDGPVHTGWSRPLALQMIQTLQSSAHYFNIETCCILKHNTSVGPSGRPCPTIPGYLVETRSGRIMPASFEAESRGPDGTIRGVYTTCVAGNDDLVPTLVSFYETASDNFEINPFVVLPAFREYAQRMLNLPDDEFLRNFSTSPFAEGPDFIPTNRRMFRHVKDSPDAYQDFPTGEPRVFTRTSSGGWVRR